MKMTALKKKAGTTLAEVIVVLFVSSILITIALGLMNPIQSLSKTIKGNAHMDAMCDTVNEYMRNILQSSKRCNVYKYSDANKSNITSAAQNMITNASSNRTKVSAVVIMKNSAGKYRIYDFGQLEGSVLSAFNAAIGTGTANETYNLFNEGYYENLSYDSVIIAGTGTAKIKTQCIIGDSGEYANQPRTIDFKLLNGSISSEFAAEDTVGDGMAVIYEKNDFNAYIGSGAGTNTASPSTTTKKVTPPAPVTTASTGSPSVTTTTPATTTSATTTTTAAPAQPGTVTVKDFPNSFDVSNKQSASGSISFSNPSGDTVDVSGKSFTYTINGSSKAVTCEIYYSNPYGATANVSGNTVTISFPPGSTVKGEPVINFSIHTTNWTTFEEGTTITGVMN